MARTGPLLFATIAVSIFGCVNSAEYLGKFLGSLSQLHHGVSGDVYAVDGRTLHIKDFTYDGQGPAAYFYASTYKTADSRGFRLRDENNNGDVIRRYRKEHVTLTLPEGKNLNNIKIFYVWCEEFDVNFGDVKIPRNFDFPRPQKIDALKGVHSISSDNIVIVDAQTLLIPNLHYDGEAPDAKFWVGRGSKPSPQGIRVMDENGKELPLRRYDGKTIVLTLPGDLTVFDIGHFGIWCEQFTVDFGHIQIPQTLNIPPSLKMLGVSPQSKLNCEVLDDELAFEVRWAVAGESIVLQLVAKLDNREYMSFGLSGDDSKTVMVGGDVVVAWIDKETLKGYAQDYYLADKSQCSGPSGSCPDVKLAEHTNNIRLLNAAMVNGYSIVTYQRPLKASDEFDLPIYTNQSQAIIWAIGPLNQRDEVSFHSSYLKRNNLINFARPAKWNCPLPEGETGKSALLPSRQTPIEQPVEPIPAQSTQPEEPEEPVTTPAPRRDGGNRRRGGGTRRRPVVNTDGAEEGQASIKEATRTRGSNRVNQRETQSRTVPPPTPVNNRDAWYIPPIQCYEPEDGVLYAQMGPTGGKRGYPAITGHVGWGISWYINGLLIPEINVVRGKTYTFVVEGGQDPEVSAKYHPFYITDDPIGGYAYKTPEEKKRVRILAGATQAKDGSIIPTGTGRLCHWTQTGDSDADDFESFGAYQRTLQLKCDTGEPGFIQWTPDKDTPDTVYYQCFTHRHLGWKINVHDSCDSQGAASEPKPVVVEAPKSNLEHFADESNVELEASESIQQEIRVIPNNNISEENFPNNKKSQPTISEIPSTLDPPTSTSQYNSDKIQNTSFLFQSQQNHLINPLSQVNSYALPYHTSGHYNNINKDASSFRPSPTIDNIEDFSFDDNTKKSVDKEMTTTEIPFTKNISRVSTLKTQTVSNVNPSITYIALPLNIVSKHTNGHFKDTRPIKQPLQVVYLPLKQSLTNNKNLQYLPMANGFKKPIFRSRPEKMHTSVMYNIQPEFNIHPILKTLPNKQQPSINTLKVSPIQTQSIPKTVPMEDIKNVEISPKQASTEREPEIQTGSPLISIHPTPNENFNFKTPVNTGFNPGSVIIEGGFKPIIGKHIEDRVDEINAEVDLEGQTGVIEVKGKKFEQNNPNKNFKTSFISSPTTPFKKQNHKKIFKKPIQKEIVKIIFRTRSLINSDIEPEMAAADRVESYYLPPPGQTEKPKISAAKQPSEIDFETPLTNKQSASVLSSKISDSSPDIVVTYDGKRVSGASLTAKPFEKSTILQQRGSKAAELIKAFPQFVPFRGDLPPLNPNVLFNGKSHHTNTHPGVLSRNLDTPLPPTVGSTSTKLTRVRRAPHHTAEHTAEQMRQLNQTSNNSTSTSGSESLMQCSFVSLVLSIALLKIFIELTL